MLLTTLADAVVKQTRAVAINFAANALAALDILQKSVFRDVL